MVAFLQSKLSRSNGAWDAKCSEAVENCGAVLNLRHLPIEVSRGQVLLVQLQKMHIRFNEL